jgi:DNA-binding NarL/FixJ family response regulator
MVTVAIFSADPVLRRNLEQLPRDDPALVIVGMVDQPSTLRELFNRDRVDVLLADVPPRELLPVYRSGNNIALLVLLDGPNAEDTARALSAGARAVLDRSASRNEIIAAIKAAIAGLVVVPANTLVTLLPEAPFADDLLKADGSRHARLTRRSGTGPCLSSHLKAFIQGAPRASGKRCFTTSNFVVMNFWLITTSVATLSPHFQ